MHKADPQPTANAAVCAWSALDHCAMGIDPTGVAAHPATPSLMTNTPVRLHLQRPGFEMRPLHIKAQLGAPGRVTSHAGRVRSTRTIQSNTQVEIHAATLVGARGPQRRVQSMFACQRACSLAARQAAVIYDKLNIPVPGCPAFAKSMADRIHLTDRLLVCCGAPCSPAAGNTTIRHIKRGPGRTLWVTRRCRHTMRRRRRRRRQQPRSVASRQRPCMQAARVHHCAVKLAALARSAATRWRLLRTKGAPFDLRA
jgi:hypothetical protein